MRSPIDAFTGEDALPVGTAETMNAFDGSRFALRREDRRWILGVSDRRHRQLIRNPGDRIEEARRLDFGDAFLAVDVDLDSVDGTGN